MAAVASASTASTFQQLSEFASYDTMYTIDLTAEAAVVETSYLPATTADLITGSDFFGEFVASQHLTAEGDLVLAEMAETEAIVAGAEAGGAAAAIGTAATVGIALAGIAAYVYLSYELITAVKAHHELYDGSTEEVQARAIEYFKTHSAPENTDAVRLWNFGRDLVKQNARNYRDYTMRGLAIPTYNGREARGLPPLAPQGPQRMGTAAEQQAANALWFAPTVQDQVRSGVETQFELFDQYGLPGMGSNPNPNVRPIVPGAPTPPRIPTPNSNFDPTDPFAWPGPEPEPDPPVPPVPPTPPVPPVPPVPEIPANPWPGGTVLTPEQNARMRQQYNVVMPHHGHPALPNAF